jgi:hypothetical protein
MFVAGENNRKSLRRSGYNGEIVVTGLPKYDALFHIERRKEKLIVVPDSPNSPRGERRKRYFQIIMDIARKFPQYEVVIKPRTTLTESFQTFDFMLGNDKHMELYFREFDDVPGNLRVLENPVSMNELSARAELMISVPGSAVFGQMLLDKPVLIVHDAVAPHDLMHDAMYRCNLDIYLQSGCGVWMEELPEYIPEGLKACRNWVEREIGLFDGRATARVADVLEAAVGALGGKVRWFPVLGCTPRDVGDRLREYRKNYDLTDEAGREALHISMLRRKVDCALAALRAMTADLAGGLDLDAEIEIYARTAMRLFDMQIDVQVLEDALYPLLVALGELADRIWNFHTNNGFFKNEVRVAAEGLMTRIGLRLLESEGELGTVWAKLGRCEHGYTLVDYILKGPADRSIALCRDMAEFLLSVRCRRLAGEYALKCLEAGEFSLGPEVVDCGRDILIRRGEEKRANLLAGAWERATGKKLDKEPGHAQ